MFVKNIVNTKKVCNSLFNETIDDIVLCTQRLYQNPKCQIRKSKFNKLMREGGRVEMMLNLFVTDSIVIQNQNILKTLQLKHEKNSWVYTRDTLLKCLKTNFGIKASWEHVVPVDVCIKDCLNNYKTMPPHDFRKWIEYSIKNSWFICLVSEGERDRIKITEMSTKRNSSNYTLIYNLSGVNKVHHLRSEII